jgi:hypothetical protein
MALIEANILTQDEAKRLTPNISVKLVDGRKDRSIPLPDTTY